MDELITKHNVIAYHNGRLQLWDTGTNKPLVSYDKYELDASYCKNNRKIKYSNTFMAINIDYNILVVYEIQTGKVINRFKNIFDFNICNTHMITLSGKKVEITELETMNKTNFSEVCGLCNLCINSKYVVGLDSEHKQLRIFNHVTKEQKMPIPTGSSYCYVLINDKNIFLMETYSQSIKYAYIRIFSLDTGKLESEFKINRNYRYDEDHGVTVGSCNMWLNPVNNNVHVSTLLTSQDVRIINIDSDTLKQTTTCLPTGNFAIGSAIAFIMQTSPADYTYDMSITHENGNTTTHKDWKLNGAHFALHATVVDVKSYIKQILVNQHIISDIANIVLDYHQVSKS